LSRADTRSNRARASGRTIRITWGYWLNYENVNGVDFWNNSTAQPAEQQAKMGTIVHRRIVKTSSGADKGELEVEMDWMMPDGQPVLHETADFIFRAGPGLRVVDRISTLTALDKPVVFKDAKDGMLGLRVRRELEQPSTDAVTYTDASGRPTTVKAMDTNGVTGLYRSSEGKTGDAVWGTRGRWTMLTGKVKQEDITLVLLDNPLNVGISDLLARAGLRLVRRQPARPGGFQQREGDIELHPSAKTVHHVPVSSGHSRQHCDDESGGSSIQSVRGRSEIIFQHISAYE
jgi:hypothetical protein